MIVTCREVESKIILNYLFREKILPNLDGYSIIDLFPGDYIDRDILLISFLKNANFFIVDPKINLNLFERNLELRGIEFNKMNNVYEIPKSNVRVYIFRKKFKQCWKQIKAILYGSGEDKAKYTFALYILEKIKDGKFTSFLRRLASISDNLVYASNVAEFPLNKNTKLLSRKKLEILTNLKHEFSNIYSCNVLEKKKIIRSVLVGLAKLDLQLIPSSFFDLF